MGSASTKSTTELVYPVKDLDYHIVRYNSGDMVPAGWLLRRAGSNSFDLGSVTAMLTNFKAGVAKAQGAGVYFARRYYLFPGPKPDKKWGPVCP